MAEKGSAYIDILIGLAVLLIALSSLVPLFVLAIDTVKDNEFKTIAQELAAKEIEAIKGLDYDDIGTPQGNPEGILEPNRAEEVNGKNFSISCQVKWVDDPSDGQVPDDVDPRDYKEVTVKVTWSTALKTNSLSLSTLIARESQEALPLGGNLVVLVKDSAGIPLANARVDLTSGPDAPKHDFTDEEGRILFPLLQVGNYEVEASLPEYVPSPNLNPQSTTITAGQTNYLEFILEKPAQLTVKLLDPWNQLITKRSHLTLSHPDAGQITTTSPNGLFEFSELFPGIWEVTNAKAASYEPTSGPVVETKYGEPALLELILIPRPSGNLHITVYQAETSETIAQATIKLTNLDTSETADGQTNQQGIFEISLEAGTYLLEVSKEGYNPSSQNVEVYPSENQFLDVYLTPQPSGGSLLVRTESLRNGRPINNIRIRVIGSQYDAEKITGSFQPGEALFENLEPGYYRVYRWSTWRRRWVHQRWVWVQANQMSTVVYRLGFRY